MRPSTSCSRKHAGLLVFALLAAACTPSVRTGDDALIPSRDVSLPPNTSPPSDAAGAASPTPTPTPSEQRPAILEFQVTDTEGRARSGVPVRYAGPERGKAITGTNGRARVSVPPGSYDIEIPVGCVEQLEVFRGSTARATAFAGTRSIVRLGGIEARAGIWLANPMTWDADPPWNVGDRVRAHVTVIDRCRQRPASPGTSVSWLRWRASPAIQIEGDTPTRAAEDQTVTIAFRCVTAGTAMLTFTDPVTGEQEDLLRIKRTFDVVEPTCS